MELVIAASRMAPEAWNAGVTEMNQDTTITIVQASLILEYIGIGHAILNTKHELTNSIAGHLV